MITITEQIKNLQNNFSKDLDSLIKGYVKLSTDPSYIAGDLYNRIIATLILEANDEEYIEITISNFSGVLREAVENYKTKELN